MTFDDLKRKPVVSMADGAKIGEVDDLVIDTARWVVAELFIAGKPGRGLIALTALKGVGPDAVTIERADAVAYNAKASGLCFGDMRRLHVVDGTGTVVGHVADVTYEANGAIVSFEVRQGGVFGLGAHVRSLAPGEVRGVGDKIITVDLPVAGT